MKNDESNDSVLDDIRVAVFKKSIKLDEETIEVRGYNFNHGLRYESLLDSYLTTGFQATNLGKAINVVNQMIDSRTSECLTEDGQPKTDNYISETFKDYYDLCQCPVPRVKPTKCLIFLAYTSNLVSSGIRETIRFLVQNRLVDVLVTSAGGIEEDFIKCLAPTLLGAFDLPGQKLRARGLNRIGNLLVPNENYCKFEDWIMPILDDMLRQQNQHNINWTPSRMISRLGHEINHPDSIYYWAHKNNIPVFCPALTDGSLGDMLYFHSYRNPGLRLDIIEDVRRINNVAVRASPQTGVLVLGGGLVKHHTMNANMMRNGADYSVYINTGQEFDGSDSGASPGEAVSWGKIKGNAAPVKVFADATLVFPLLVAKTFAAKHHAQDHHQNFGDNGRDSTAGSGGGDNCNGVGDCAKVLNGNHD